MNLFDWTKKNEITDADLAKMLGMRRTETIRRWKNKHFEPSAKYKRKIYSLTNGAVTPNDFFTGGA